MSSPFIEGNEYISAIDTGDASAGAGEEDDSSPIEEGDESVSAISDTLLSVAVSFRLIQVLTISCSQTNKTH